ARLRPPRRAAPARPMTRVHVARRLLPRVEEALADSFELVPRPAGLVALLLTLLRRVVEGDRLVRRGDPWRLDPMFMLGRGLRGLRLGVVGYGRIGREVGRLGEAHGMEVVPIRRGLDGLE